MTLRGQRLADRLGKTTHVSPLRMRLQALWSATRPEPGTSLEDWLIDIANSRGACIVFREYATAETKPGLPFEQLSNEELVVAICHLQGADRPQMLRLAAQLISRRAVDVKTLCLAAERERVACILADLARLALRVDPRHEVWRALADRFAAERPLRDTLLHWTRLAEPHMANGRCNAASWSLVA